MDRKTVLVVDDDAATRDGYTAFLVDCGYRVLQAAHGGEAILQVYHHRPHVVLLDLAMPVLDGLETARSLRMCTGMAGTRIIAVTACQSSRQLDQMLALCDSLVLKPCDPVAIEYTIRSMAEVGN